MQVCGTNPSSLTLSVTMFFICKSNNDVNYNNVNYNNDNYNIINYDIEIVLL